MRRPAAAAGELDALARSTGFSGVVTVERDGRPVATVVRGHADRANRRPITTATRFGVASVTKGLTALAVASLVEDGLVTVTTTLRSVIGEDLPHVHDRVTIGQLLEHTSGVGDYLDEDELDDVDAQVLDVPVDRLARPEAYLAVIDGHPQRSDPGERFAYNNGGYVMLSIAIERLTGRSFYDVVDERVLRPAGMTATGFFRSDDLPPDAALGYLGSGRTNVFHLPVRGAGDGGAYSTAGDLGRLWDALFTGRIVSTRTVEEMVTARHGTADGTLRYGRGFWLRPDRATVMLEGMDAGVSARTAHDRPSGLRYTVLSNTTDGAWPLVRHLDSHLPELVDVTGR